MKRSWIIEKFSIWKVENKKKTIKKQCININNDNLRFKIEKKKING